MMPPSDMNTDPRALTPEERELAQRLARLGSNGGPGPSPDLDARILAAAHDAVARAPARRAQQRWPVALGIAASLALAIGVAWQLRPLPDTSAAYQSEMPARMVSEVPPDVAGDAAATASAAAPAESAATQQTAVADIPSPAPPLPPPAAGPEPPKPAARIAARPAPPAPEAAVVQPDIVFDTAAPVLNRETAAAKAAANTQSQTPPAAPTAAERQTAPAPASNAAATALPETDTLDRLQSAGTRDAVESDEPGADVPPATMASPEARDAWLARIRELVAAGRVDAARASLREFTHRYPDFQLPADLRALAQ